MEEILFALGEHATGLNAGRWDYLFSIIKTFRASGLVLPDRAALTMTVPFMRAYTRRLVEVCHRRGAHAIGGMAAYVPSRRDPSANELAFAKVREDKEREAADGFDGTWVAHPDLVPVARAVFDATLGERPNQLERPGEPVDGRGPPRLRRPGGRGHRGRAPLERLGRPPVPGGLARRERRRRHQQPHGGRGDGRDRPLAPLALAAIRVAVDGEPLTAGRISAGSGRRRPRRSGSSGSRRDRPRRSSSIGSSSPTSSSSF
ncbi:MAG: hypothetical protein KatS3mg065_0949 [Chloroflexota bacterium]|nr:MAG: hypothetical protein KatS3mg065_0949 [Chloroflexota bacterium]